MMCYPGTSCSCSTRERRRWNTSPRHVCSTSTTHPPPHPNPVAARRPQRRPLHLQQRRPHPGQPAPRAPSQAPARPLRRLPSPAPALRDLQISRADRWGDQSQGGGGGRVSGARQGAADARSGVHEGVGVEEDCCCRWGCLGVRLLAVSGGLMHPGIAMAFGTMRHEGGVGWSMCWNAMIPR